MAQCSRCCCAQAVSESNHHQLGLFDAELWVAMRMSPAQMWSQAAATSASGEWRQCWIWMGPGSPSMEQGEQSSSVLVQCAGGLKLHAKQGQATCSSWLVVHTTMSPQASVSVPLLMLQAVCLSLKRTCSLKLAH